MYQGEFEPLRDPLTLLRFFNSRDKSVTDSCYMYKETVKWRTSFDVPRVMARWLNGTHTHTHIKQIKKQRWKKTLHDMVSLVLLLPIVFSLS